MKKPSTPSDGRRGPRKPRQAASRGAAVPGLVDAGRILFDTMSQGVVFRDTDGRIVSANPAALRIFSRQLADLLGKTSAEAHPGAVNAEGVPLAADDFPAEVALRTGRQVRDFVMGIRNPGEDRLRWLSVDATPFRPPGAAAPALVYLLFEDITERRRAAQELSRARDHLEQEVQQRTRELVEANEALGAEIAVRERTAAALRESEDRFRRLAENAKDLIYVYRLLPERRFEYVSPSAAAITGYTPEEHYADPDLGMKMVHAEDRRKLEALAGGAGSSPEPLVLRWVRKDGRLIWIEQRNIRIADDAGRTVAIQGVARDITEQVQIEEKLRASERFLQTIIDSAPECIKLLARDGTLLTMNRSGLAMIDATSLDEVQGRDMSDLVITEHRAAFRQATAAAFAGASAGLAFEAVGLKGRRVWLETRVVPLRDEQQEIMAALAITRDITEQRKMQEKLRESEGNLREAQRLAAFGSWEWTPETGQLAWSPETVRILDLPRDDAVPSYERLLRSIHPEDRDAFSRAVDAALRGMSLLDLEHRIVQPGGSVRVVHSRGQVTIGQAGAPVRMLGTLQDLSEHRRAEELLPLIARHISEKTGEDFFRSVVKFIAEDLGMQIVFIGEFLEETKRVRTLTVFTHGAFGENFEYDLDNTPCDNVVGKSPCFYPERVQALFPKDAMLADLGIHGYAGIPLFTSSGAPLGLIVTLSTRPMRAEDRRSISMLLQIFAGRVAAELERQRSERELRRSEQRYRDLLASVTSYVYTVQVKGGMAVATTHGAGCVSVTGYTAEEFARSPYLWYTMVHDNDKSAVLAQADRVLAGIQPAPLEHRLRHRSGKIVWVRNTVVPRFNDLRQLVAYDGLIEDITERKRTESFINNILESVDEGFLIIGRDYTIISANRAYCEQVGLPATEIVGKKCYAVSHRIPGPCFEHGEECAVRIAFETGSPRTVLHSHHDAGGAPQAMETKAFPLRDDSGQVFAAIEIVNNVTEKIRLEEQLRHAQKMEAVGLLAGGVAHDFNNILTAIVGYGNLLKLKTEADDPRQAFIEQLLASAARAANLTRSLLAFSRKQVINPSTLDIHTVIRRVEQLLRPVIGEDIDLRLALADGPLTVLSDSSQLEQVMMNLCTNARDAMPRGGTLTIATGSAVLDDEFRKQHGFGRPGVYAAIAVTDTGTGMDEATRKRVFDPFFTTKETGKGTGLGLAIVYGIVKQNAGFVTVESEPGRGATFRLYLPLVTASAEPPRTHEPTVYQEGHETVLIAEDDAALRRLTKTMMTEFGYTVIDAVDGEDALQKFREHCDAIQLVILDAVMPKMSGLEVQERILGIKPGMKFLFISGYSSEALVAKGMQERPTNFIVKPVSPMDLLRTVRAILDDGRAGGDPSAPTR